MWTNMMNSQYCTGAGLGMIGMTIFWILIFTLAVMLAGQILGYGRNRDKRQQPKQKTSLDILSERYASGEVPRGEFEEKKRDLEG